VVVSNTRDGYVTMRDQPLQFNDSNNTIKEASSDENAHLVSLQVIW